MLLQQLNRGDAERVFVIVQNNSNVTVTNGAVMCVDHTATVASFGNAVNSASGASAQALFAGLIDADTATTAYGLLQVYGYRASCVVNVGAASVSAAGLQLGPAAGGAGRWSLQTNGLTFILGPVLCLDNDISATGWRNGFIRAL